MGKRIITLLIVVLWASTVWGVPPGFHGSTVSTAYQITSCTIYLAEETGATETRLAVYNSSGSKIGERVSTTIGTGFPKLMVNSFTSGPTMVPG